MNNSLKQKMLAIGGTILTREEMKKVGGGMALKKCTKDSDCGGSISIDCTTTTITVKVLCNNGTCVHAGCPS
jgi:hypothetical protein